MRQKDLRPLPARAARTCLPGAKSDERELPPPGAAAVIDLWQMRRQMPAVSSSRAAAAVDIHCRVFSPGSEDWNRGLRDLKASYVYAGCLTRQNNGAIVLRGLPCGELLLTKEQVKQCLAAGFRIASTDFDAEIPVEAFRAALATLPKGGVISFRSRH
jgi:hypothetical protein